MHLIFGGKNILMGYGQVWKLQRKIAHSALRVYGGAQGILEEKVAEEVRFVQVLTLKASGEGGSRGSN